MMLAAPRGSLLAYDKPPVIAAVRSQRARTIALLESLAPSAWETTVLPGWRVREVAAHLITTDEGALTGRLLRLGLRQVPMETVEAWNDAQVARWADRPVPSLLHGLDRWGRRLARALVAGPQAIAAREVPTPFGRVSLLWLGMLRVYDEWVHGEDVRRALERESDDETASVLPVARHLLAALPVQTLPRIPPGAGGALTLSFSDLVLPPIGVDLGERRFGIALAGRGSLVAARAAPFVMVAAGREGWREAEARGDLVVDGERGPAETFLDALRVV